MASNGSSGKAKRAEMIKGLRERIKESTGMVFVDMQKLDSAETTDLRKAIRPSAASLKVVKNRLMKLACEKEQVPDCGGWLKQNTAVAFLGGDPIAGLKALTTFAADHDKLSIKGGLLEKQTLDLAAIQALAALPGRRELLAMTAGTMKGPLVRAARDFQSLIVKMVLLMKEAAKKAPKA